MPISPKLIKLINETEWIDAAKKWDGTQPMLYLLVLDLIAEVERLRGVVAKQSLALGLED